MQIRLNRPVRLGILGAIVATSVLSWSIPAAADPSFGVAPGGLLSPGNVYNPALGAPMIGPLAPPTTVISAASLGLPPAAVVDDISFGASVYPSAMPFHAIFSVGLGSTGHPGSPPAPSPHPSVFQDAVGPGDGAVAADIFSSYNITGSGGPLGAFSPVFPPAPCGPIETNIQTADENGVAPGAFAPNVGLGLTPADNLNKLDIHDHSFADFIPAGGDGNPDIPVFFTVSPATAAALPLLPPFFGGMGPQTGADVLAWDPTTSALYDWAPQAMLGMAGVPNDIDALSVYYPAGSPPISAGWVGAPDTILFSFAPGSPSNPGFGSICFGPGSGTPGDVYFDTAPFGAPPAPAIDAEMLGLNTVRSGGGANDNLDAIDLAPATFMDTDGDGIDDAVDFDLDGDGVGNRVDNCPTVPNAAQTNADGNNAAMNRGGYDSLGDACDSDADGDGYTAAQEAAVVPPKSDLSYCLIMRADVNTDGSVNALDMNMLGKKFLQSFTHVDPPNGVDTGLQRLDQNGDNAINALDMNVLGKRFLQNVSAC
jgi:hypothetical protein